MKYGDITQHRIYDGITVRRQNKDRHTWLKVWHGILYLEKDLVSFRLIFTVQNKFEMTCIKTRKNMLKFSLNSRIMSFETYGWENDFKYLNGQMGK